MYNCCDYSNAFGRNGKTREKDARNGGGICIGMDILSEGSGEWLDGVGWWRVLCKLEFTFCLCQLDKWINTLSVFLLMNFGEWKVNEE